MPKARYSRRATAHGCGTSFTRTIGSSMGTDFGINQGLVEEMYFKYRENPTSVNSTWQHYFDSLDEDFLPPRRTAVGKTAPGTLPGQLTGPVPGDKLVGKAAAETKPATTLESDRRSFVPGPETRTATELQSRVSQMVNAYRVRGHLFADLDPLKIAVKPEFDIDLPSFGLGDVDVETTFDVGDMSAPSRVMPLREIVRRLRDTYCRSIGVEYTHIEAPDEREWLQGRMESTCNHVTLTREQQLQILAKLTDAEMWEGFVASTWVGAKRFSVEGGESAIALIELVVGKAASLGVEEVVLGMAHRGRLNVLVNVMGQPPQDLIAEFDDIAPENKLGRADVKYHLGFSSDRVFDGKSVHLTLCFNPSHLEFVNPVVEGRVRAKQDRRGDTERKRVMPLLIHGDAAFIGQGVVAETLNMAGTRAYHTGGTVHVVINNQVGFTTDFLDSRSSRYCTDIVRMLRCPVFHVNGEDPEAVAQVAMLAAEYRQKFSKDVVIDLYCYRKFGHNEGDEPRFTQPVMYQAIDAKETVRKIYVKTLSSTGLTTHEDAERIAKESRQKLENALKEVRDSKREFEVAAYTHLWEGFRGGADLDVPDATTNVSLARAKELLVKLGTVPEGFETMRQITQVLASYKSAAETGQDIRWGIAENLAYATLLTEGYGVRITGQDVQRGTFAHRHCVLSHAKTGEKYAPLHHLDAKQARFEAHDSTLSESGVMGFEYGYSLDTPDALVIWEAQFGDFANGAQVIIDQFVTSSEDKWDRLNGLVLLLPHGFEGAGPEHSSARLERFLSLAAEDNIQVVNLTTAAQIYHALRRQVKRPLRKPLIVMSPKSLLRSADAASTLDDLVKGSFQRIIPDIDIAPKKAKRVLLCSGKIYYELAKKRKEESRDDIAIVRLEQLYPIRAAELEAVLAPYAEGTELIWVQEEPWNMGAWYFIHARVPAMLGARFTLRCIARPESASPATGSLGAHKLEQKAILDEAFAAATRVAKASTRPRANA